MKAKLIFHLQHGLPKSKKFPTRAQFVRWIQQALQSVREISASPFNPAELTLRIVDTSESAELNLTYRKKTGPTNVLSFPFEPIPGVEENYLGDLAICASIVEKEAQAQNKSALDHWAHLTVHGVLHLLGYDHQVDAEAEIMEALEIKILSQLGIANPYKGD